MMSSITLTENVSQWLHVFRATLEPSSDVLYRRTASQKKELEIVLFETGPCNIQNISFKYNEQYFDRYQHTSIDEHWFVLKIQAKHYVIK